MEQGDRDLLSLSLTPHPATEPPLSPQFRELEQVLGIMAAHDGGPLYTWPDPGGNAVVVRLGWGQNHSVELRIPLQDFATRTAYVSLSRFRCLMAGAALLEQCDAYLGGAVSLRPEGAVLHAFDGNWRYDPELGRLVPWEGNRGNHDSSSTT